MPLNTHTCSRNREEALARRSGAEPSEKPDTGRVLRDPTDRNVQDRSIHGGSSGSEVAGAYGVSLLGDGDEKLDGCTT